MNREEENGVFEVHVLHKIVAMMFHAVTTVGKTSLTSLSTTCNKLVDNVSFTLSV